MAYSVFLDKDHEPADEELVILGEAETLWRHLTGLIESKFRGTERQWVYSGKNHGWALRLKEAKRSIIYLTPAEGEFRVAYAMGAKAVAAVQASDLPDAVKDLVSKAPKYAEGHGVRFVVRDVADVHSALALAKIKMAN